MPGRIDSLVAMLEKGPDTALLRFSLGNEYLGQGDFGPAAEHLQKAVELDPDYSAAWKLLGKSLASANRSSEAIDAYRQGIETAQAMGDRQAAKEMTVFLKRLQKGGSG